MLEYLIRRGAPVTTYLEQNFNNAPPDRKKSSFFGLGLLRTSKAKKQEMEIEKKKVVSTLLSGKYFTINYLK